MMKIEELQNAVDHIRRHISTIYNPDDFDSPYELAETINYRNRRIRHYLKEIEDILNGQ